MDELERWSRDRVALVQTRDDRAHRKAMQHVVRQARESALETKASAALASLGMELSVDLYKYGQALAGDDPMLAGLMNRFVGTFADGALRRQRDFDSGFWL